MATDPDKAADTSSDDDEVETEEREDPEEAE